MKKLIALLLALVMCFALVGCGTPAPAESEAPETPETPDAPVTPDAPAEPETPDAPANPSAGLEIYFLNFKPEVSTVYEAVAAAYEAETGVKVKVVTAASNEYEPTLRAEITKTNPPTIFQINGPIGYGNWKDYCADLSGTELYNMLSDKTLAVTSGDGVYGIPYAVEGYGIIYNQAIMDAYFALPGKATTYTSMSEINNFEALKAVVEDMTANKDALGIQGVFASTSFSAGNDWRWQTHLANMPLYYEFNDIEGYDSTITAGLDAQTIEFKYNANYKNIFDLYLNNSITPPNLIGAKTVDDSMAEFALGNVAMVQNGNWAAGQILGTAGAVVAPENIKFMPIYTGVAGEETQGLCVGTENFLCVNSKVSPELQKASVDFLVWLFGSDAGKQFVVNDLMFMAPFTTFGDDEKPSDPLGKEVLVWMEKEGVHSVPWTFAAFPSEAFKAYLGEALLEYAQGNYTWEDVTTITQNAWASEKAQ